MDGSDEKLPSNLIEDYIALSENHHASSINLQKTTNSNSCLNENMEDFVTVQPPIITSAPTSVVENLQFEKTSFADQRTLSVSNHDVYRQPPLLLSEYSSSSSESDLEPLQTDKNNQKVFSRPLPVEIESEYTPRLPDNPPTNSQLKVLGKVLSRLSGCVVIESIANVPALDTGSALYLSETQPLGEVYETFGPVKSPFYCVVLENIQPNPVKKKPSKPRIRNRSKVEIIEVDVDGNTNNHCKQIKSKPLIAPIKQLIQSTPVDVPIKQKDNLTKATDQSKTATSPIDAPKKISVDVNIGDFVYYVPDNPDLSMPILCSELEKLRGSDASGYYDNEIPLECQELSDDEEELLRNRKQASKRPISARKPRQSNENERTKSNQFSTSSLRTRNSRDIDRNSLFQKSIIQMPNQNSSFPNSPRMGSGYFGPGSAYKPARFNGSWFAPNDRLPKTFNTFRPPVHGPLGTPDWSLIADNTNQHCDQYPSNAINNDPYLYSNSYDPNNPNLNTSSRQNATYSQDVMAAAQHMVNTAMRNYHEQFISSPAPQNTSFVQPFQNRYTHSNYPTHLSNNNQFLNRCHAPDNLIPPPPFWNQH